MNAPGGTAVLVITSAWLVTPCAAWMPIGTIDAVQVREDGTTRIASARPVSAGVVSEAFSAPEGTDAVLVKAHVEAIPARTVTFSVHDAGTGETLGYWQNPLRLDTGGPITAALRLSRQASRLRVFAGLHDSPGQVVLGRLEVRPLHSGMTHPFAVYGALINGGQTPRQTFRAEGDSVEAVSIRILQLHGGREGPDLRVRLYAWEESIGTTLKGNPLAETIVPRERIPGDPGIGGEEMVATYGASEIDLTVPIAARTIPGRTYLLELSTDAPAAESQGYLSFAWMNGYDHGQLYRNLNPTDWDLWLEVYHGLR